MKRIKHSQTNEMEGHEKVEINVKIFVNSTFKEEPIAFNERDFRLKLAETINDLFGKLGIVKVEINALELSEKEKRAKIVCPKSQISKISLILFFVTNIKGQSVRIKTEKIEPLLVIN